MAQIWHKLKNPLHGAIGGVCLLYMPAIARN